jgi:hypothetical protein
MRSGADTRVMMPQHRTGRGGWERRRQPPSLLLFNFDIDDDALKHEHRVGLLDEVVPRLKAGDSISVVGLASRTGSHGHNRALSGRRAKRTLAFLRHEVPNGFAAKEVVSFGELKATQEGQPDGTEDPRFRSVILFVGRSAEPPPTHETFDLSPESLLVDALFPGTDWLSLVSKIHDVVAGALGFADFVPAAEVTATAGLLGEGLSVLSLAALMPLTWTGIHNQNIANGRIEGYVDAVQSMADAFPSPALPALPLSMWPPLPVPTPRRFSPLELTLVNQREWMQGRREGCALAYQLFHALDRSPLILNGRPLSGRRILARLRAHLGSEGVKPWLMSAVNAILIRSGQKGWPIR